MASESKISRLLETLVLQTITGNLKWTAGTPRGLNEGSDDVIKHYCETEYKGQHLAVFERRVRTYDGERDSYYWNEYPVFAIVQHGELVWEYDQNTNEVATMLRVARESAANVNEMLDKLLA